MLATRLSEEGDILFLSRKAGSAGARIAGATLLGTAILLAVAPGMASAYSLCIYHSDTQWYGQALAPVNAGTADGVYITESMPSTYHVGSQGMVDEAATVINWTWYQNNFFNNYTSNGEWDVGWFMGVWFFSTSHTYYYNPHAYADAFSGYRAPTDTWILSSSDLPENGDSVRYLVADVETNCPEVQVYDLTTNHEFAELGLCFSGTSIEIPTTRQLLSEGEVSSSIANDDQGGWMGGNGGNGLASTGYAEQYSNHTFYPWGGYPNNCMNSPYWSKILSADSWSNGGSG